MIGSILKMLAYRQAPRTTFAMLHPDTAFHIAKMQWDFEHAYAPRVAAIVTAAIALPVGIIVGRAIERGVSRRQPSSQSLPTRQARVGPGTAGARPPASVAMRRRPARNGP